MLRGQSGKLGSGPTALFEVTGMSAKVFEPAKGVNAFNCPRCGAFAKFDWYQLIGTIPGGAASQIKHEGAKCQHCGVFTLWAAVEVSTSPQSIGYEYRLVYPAKMTAPQAHPDLPKECDGDFEEARQVLDLSPRVSAALLRLVAEKLCRRIC